MKDEEIVKQLRQKDSGVFDHIMERYNKLLWVVVGNVLGSAGTPEDIEDCISDVYVKLIENPRSYDPAKGSLKSFLAKVAKNLAIDRYRKLRKLEALWKQVPGKGRVIYASSSSSSSSLSSGLSSGLSLSSSSGLDEDMLQSLISKESRDKLWDAVDSLKEPDREIILRRFILNEKVSVIAEKMFLQKKEIENKLYQGKKRLKMILANEEG